MSESVDDTIDSDPADDFASVSHEDNEEEGIDLLAPLRDKIVNIGDHLKARKGVIGGKFKCDRNGCHMVEAESADSSL